MAKFYHAFLGVTDMRKSLEFYTTVFEGARISREFEIDGNEMIFLDLDNGLSLELNEFPPDVVQTHVIDVVDNGAPILPIAGVFQHIAIECTSKEELEALYSRMIAAGAELVRPLNFGFKLNGRNGTPDVIANGAHLKGPDGEVIELCLDLIAE